MLSIFDQGPPPPVPTPFNMAAHVLRRAQDLADKQALSVLHSDHVQSWSFADISAAIRGIATGLRQRGLGAGDRILLRLGNTPETPFAYLAAIAVDMIPVPTSAQLTEVETAKIIDQLSPTLILHDTDVPCPDHPARVDLSDLRAMMDLPPAEFVMGAPDRPAYIVYTSGTSGMPRAVLHAHRAIWARQMMHDGWYGLRPDDRLLHAGAFNWTFTMGTGLMDPWSVGATALIPAPGTAPEALPGLLAKHEATLFAAAPGVYRKILKHHDKINLPYLRHGLSAGEKLSDTVRQGWQDATDTRIYEAYGMSECSTFLSACPDHPATGDALGQPQPGRHVAIVDDTGIPTPRGAPGTIAVHKDDPGLMLGYLDAPEATAARFAGDWFLTGDQGAMQSDGQISYLGRADDMMNAGGYRVSPLEVEAALAGAPGIETVAVTEIEAKQDAKIIVAFYTSASELDKTALDTFARARLAGYKLPRDYVRLTELPTGPNGKISRKALAAYWRHE
ncbi:long-chain fatty acid--CoA ligase [Aliishimia ponticola]|uniref:Long-chain fatty acid--CoA ligase n=1 Tax=Aliishimia ponticola TaxID=2499833 RepID=A0A4V3XKY1_9RHOB|nr:class I adenylate-forming enzyme family protein [Aliishimia ponticola]THH38723.1 long-chain fatty acid--CoA ligase [Aliishimia ponticola]